MSARILLLDIEGTTSSIAYVYEKLFPYVRGELRAYLAAHWNDLETREACERLAREAGAASLNAFAGGNEKCAGVEKIAAEIFRLMDSDVKSTGLKELQGLVSRAGYASGKLRSHFYPDVPPALKRWTDKGMRCCVYSSGSIAAQKNFYSHAEAGDLSAYIQANFDTTTGPKREAASYEKIAAALNADAGSVTFFSDVVEELNAAKEAGMGTVLIVRPGNKPALEGHGHKVAGDFNAID